MTGQRNRPRSWEVTDGPQRAPARAYLRAVGFSEEDFGKPQIGVASSWNEVTPCNYHLDKLAALAKEGVRQGGAVPLEFTTIAVSDGIAMGHEGMKASLMSRDLIADSVELRDARRALRRPRRDRRLRQVRARDADGDGAARPAGRLPLRRHDPARAHIRGATSRSKTCSRPSAPTRREPSTTTSSERSSAPPARPPDRAPGCTRPTRWRASVRRSGCRSPAAPARRRSTTGARSRRARRASP